eukprot:scaffold6832_cov81-Skeletonema_menzelii.AAC.32
MGAVTCDLGEYRKMNQGQSLGRICYSNFSSAGGSSPHRSVMFQSLNNKCLQTMKFLVEKGSVITDEDFLRITKCKLLKRFLSMVACIQSTSSLHKPSQVTARVLQSMQSWNKDLDWSFPPTWKVAVILCRNCEIGFIRKNRNNVKAYNNGIDESTHFCLLTNFAGTSTCKILVGILVWSWDLFGVHTTEVVEEERQ